MGLGCTLQRTLADIPWVPESGTFSLYCSPLIGKAIDGISGLPHPNNHIGNSGTLHQLAGISGTLTRHNGISGTQVALM